MVSPEEAVLLRETVSEVVNYINRNLSQMERAAILIRAAKKYPVDAPRTHSYSYKSLDNARRRAIRKLRRAFPYI